MKVVILVPFRGDGGWRDRAWEHVRRHLGQLPYELVVGDSGDEPFSFGRTFNKLADRPWDVAVLHDADLIASLGNIVEAVDTAGPGIAYPWDHLVSLTREASERYPDGPIDIDPERERRRLPAGGVRVVTRDLWEAVKGFDSWFCGWGGEDDAFAIAAKVMAGPPRRLPGPLIELWHPRPTSDPYYRNLEENRRRVNEMRQWTPGQVRAYVAARSGV